MKKILFVFPSPSVGDIHKLFNEYIDTSKIDVAYLCSESKPKILKKDIDLDISIIEEYDIVCPVGAESLKYISGLTGITKYNGIVVNDNQVPLINPTLVEFKPQYKDDIIKACTNLEKIINGETKSLKVDKDYAFVTDSNTFYKYYDELQSVDAIVVDIETTSLYARKGEVIGIALSSKPNQGIFVSSDICYKHKEELHELFKYKVCIFHNSKFDVNFLEYEFNFEFNEIEDTMLLHYCLEETIGTHGLKQLALKYTDLGDYERELDEYKKSFCRKNKILLKEFNYGMLPLDILAPYAMKDADATYQLYNKFKPLVANNDKFNYLYTTLLIPGTKTLIKVENNGGPINRDQLVTLMKDYEIDIEECINEIALDKDVARFERVYNKPFNPNSVAQLQKVFFEIKNLTPLKKTDSGNWSVDKEVLQYLKEEENDTLADAILDLRVKTKLYGTYVKNIAEGLDTDDRLRSNFNLHGTTSGRLSSSGTINYQNIPRDEKDIKKLFKARPGYKIVQGDLGTAEVYYAAVLSDDKFLQKAFIDKLDFHSYIAKQIFNLPCSVDEVKKLYPEQRQYAKAITFGIMYQAGPSKIAETANISVSDAREFIKKYFREASNLQKFIYYSNNQIETSAFIYSFFGRKRRLPESKSQNKGVAAHAIRSGVNFLVQSVASDINLLGLIDAVNWIGENNYQKDILPFTIVHDSIVAEVKEELVDLWARKLTEFIQTDRGLTIPNTPIKFDIEVGDSWGELTNYTFKDE